MAKNSSLVLIALLIVSAGCTRGMSGLSRPSTLARWERQMGLKSDEDRSVTKRAPAQSVAPRCLKDRLDAGGFRAEIASRESQVGSKKFVYQGVERTLPIPQAAFLTYEGGKWIYSGPSVDTASCADLPCIVNRIYGVKDDAEIGLMVYLFYLRTGYVIGLTGAQPSDDNDPANPVTRDPETFRESLFSEAELKSLLIISHAYPENFVRLASLKTIHRAKIGGLYLRPGSFTCGWARMSYSFFTVGKPYTFQPGSIELSDACLTSPATPKFAGGFWMGPTHELAHHLDYSLRQATGSYGGANDIHFSQGADWLALSGWALESVIDPEDGVTQRSWKKDPSAEGFVTAYAGGNPMEDFPETVASFRFRSDVALEKTPKKSEFLRKKFFGGRSYDSAGLFETYRGQVRSSVQEKLVDVAKACLVDGKTDADFSGARVIPLGLEVALPEARSKCLIAAFQDAVSKALDQIYATEYEACDLINPVAEVGIRLAIAQQLSPDLNKVLGEQAVVANLLKASKALRATLVEEVDAREAFIHCVHRDSAHECFAKSLSDRFDELVAPFAADLGETVAIEKDFFLKSHAFDEVRTQVLKFFTYVFAGSDKPTRQFTEARWRECSRPDTQAPQPALVSTAPFSGGARFVDARILECLNTGLLERVNAVRDQVSGKMGLTVSDPDVGKLVTESLFLPSVLEGFEERVASEAKAEAAVRAERAAAIVDVIAAGVLGDLSWLDGIKSLELVSGACEIKAATAFDEYSGRLSAGDQLPTRFYPIEDLRLQIFTEACKKVVKNGAVTDKVKAAIEAEFDALFAEAKTRMQLELKTVADDCTLYIKTTVLEWRKKRRSCVNERWTARKEAVMASVTHRATEISAELDRNRRDWVDQALK